MTLCCGDIADYLKCHIFVTRHEYSINKTSVLINSCTNSWTGLFVNSCVYQLITERQNF